VAPKHRTDADEEEIVSSATILTSRSGGVTRLTLNRPDKLNAFTRAMHAELREGLTGAGADPDCRVVVLTGAGRAFSAGQSSPSCAMPAISSDRSAAVSRRMRRAWLAWSTRPAISPGRSIRR